MANIRKGSVIHFLKDNRKELILKANRPNNRITGEVVTENRVYSVDYIRRWKELGFLKIIKNEE